MTANFTDAITPALLDTIAALLPNGITLRGIAVEHSATDEGALIQWEGSMTAYAAQDADVWAGIAQDARRIYMDYVGDMMIEQINPTIH